MKIDNFALTMHQSCPLKFWYRMENGWQLRRRSGALGFGAAFHAGIGEWYKHEHLTNKERLELAVQAIHEGWDHSVPIDDYRTLIKCVTTFEEYTRFYPQETFTVVGAPERPIVEQTFTLPLGTYLPCRLSWIKQDDPDDNRMDAYTRRQCNEPHDIFVARCRCGRKKEPIEYGGIFDGLVEFGNKVYVFEHKTTSQLGSYYFTQFKPNNQVTGYIWAAGQLSGMDVAGAMINAIGVYKVGKTKFERQVTTRDKLDIAEWVRNVTASCEEIAAHRLTGIWPMRTISCTQYGLCEFHQVDTLSDPHWRQKRLETDYVRSEWDYTRRDENAEGKST